MFQKPFKVRSSTAIKGSDRKKLRAEVGKQFALNEQVNEIIPSKDEILVTKVYTSSGESVVIYSVSKNPVLFEDRNKILYPTVYLLWRYPDLLPIFTTWPPVFGKLSNGADLMLPGIVVKGQITPHSLGNLQKGDRCAINLVGNKSPISVGITALSSEDMYSSAMRGKGVIVLHTHTDFLWQMGDKSQPPLIEDSSSAIPNEQEIVESCDSSNTSEQNQACEPNIVTTDSLHSSNTDNMCNIPRIDDNSIAFSELGSHDNKSIEETEEESNTTEDMNALLYQCFLAALKRTVKKSDLPLLTSKFYRGHLVPCCPAGKNVDIKKSSYKKLSKFLKEMESRRLIVIKELSKGVESIVEVDRGHLELKNLELTESMSAANLNTADSSNEDGGYVPAVITEMFLVAGNMAELFKASGFSKGKGVTAQEVRKVITDYVKVNELQSESNRSEVIMDPILTDCILNKGERDPSLRWDDLFRRCLDKMPPCYYITLPGQRAVLKKGRITPVTITVNQRGGNKKVTLIENLETYGIESGDVAHRCQITLACSTSTSALSGNGRGTQVMVQGSQVHFVADLLTNKYHLDKKYIQGIDKTSKPKKK